MVDGRDGRPNALIKALPKTRNHHAAPFEHGSIEGSSVLAVVDGRDHGLIRGFGVNEGPLVDSRYG